MNIKLIFLYIIFIGFLAFTAYSLAVTEEGFFDWVKGLLSVPSTAQLVIDLYIACGLILAWMFHDVRSRGKPITYWVVFAIVTLITASLGPLLYLIIREHQINAATRPLS